MEGDGGGCESPERGREEREEARKRETYAQNILHSLGGKTKESKEEVGVGVGGWGTVES